MTVIPTGGGWLHLAVMLDLYSRRIVGWAMGNERSQALSLAALRMAIEHRRPKAGLLYHSDRGSAYGGALYQAQIQQVDAVASMSRKGDAYDNAVVDSFFGNLKNELIHHRIFGTRDQARAEIFDYIEIFYNRRRAHATLQYVSPAEYENSRRVAEKTCPENPGYLTDHLLHSTSVKSNVDKAHACNSRRNPLFRASVADPLFGRALAGRI